MLLWFVIDEVFVKFLKYFVFGLYLLTIQNEKQPERSTYRNKNEEYVDDYNNYDIEQKVFSYEGLR